MWTGSEEVATPAQTIDNLNIKPNPKVEVLVLPKFGVGGAMLTPKSLLPKEDPSTAQTLAQAKPSPINTPKTIISPQINMQVGGP